MTSQGSGDLPSESAVHPPRLAFFIAFLVYTLFALSVTLVPIRTDNDCWWHVKSGAYIAEHGLPVNDVFSFAAEDHEWHNHEWLSQLAFHGAHVAGEGVGVGGWSGVIVFTAAMVWATYAIAFLLAGRLSGSWWIALLIAVIAVSIGRRTFAPRPPVISNLLLMGQITLFVAIAEGWIRRRWIIAIVPVIALWTNLHGGWMAAGIVLAAFMADQFISHFRDRLPRLPFDRALGIVPPRLLIALGAATLLATLANPYGWRLYELPARVMGDTSLVRAIGELRQPEMYFVIDFEFAVHAAFVLALLVGGRVRKPLWEILIWLFFLHQAIHHVRHLLLFSVMLVPMYARLAGAAADAARASLAEWRPSAPWLMRVPGAASLLLALGLAQWVIVAWREGGRPADLLDFRPAVSPPTYPQRNAQLLGGTAYIRDRFPAALADVIEMAEPTGRMFNENHYAGYLIWRLSPEKHKVFSDSRFDIFGGTIWRDEESIATGADDWSALLDKYDIQWAIARADTGLEARMAQPTSGWTAAATVAPRWRIFVRNTPENAAMIDRFKAAAAVTVR